MIVCPSCDRSWDSDVHLASHLITSHGLEPQQAVMRAQEAAKEAARVERRVEKLKRGDAMATKTDRSGECPECHRLRHKKGCSRYIGSTHKKTPDVPLAAKRREPVARGHRKPPEKSPNGNGVVPELEALATVAATLEPLQKEARSNVLACIAKLLHIDLSGLPR